MLVLINTISLVVARTLASAASLLSHLRRSLAQAHADRARVEAELFHGRYHLQGKQTGPRQIRAELQGDDVASGPLAAR